MVRGSKTGFFLNFQNFTVLLGLFRRSGKLWDIRVFGNYFSKFSSDFPMMKLTKTESVKIDKGDLNSKKFIIKNEGIIK